VNGCPTLETRARIALGLCFFDEGAIDAAHGVAAGDVLTRDGH
jgi:hypothetical protein